MNGKTYEMQYLSDEEAAVINAMRMGAKVDIYFFKLDNLDEVEERMSLFGKLEHRNKRAISLESEKTRSAAFMEFYEEPVSATCYVRMDK